MKRRLLPRPSTSAHTIEPYQHLLPGMQAEAAPVFEQLIVTSASPPDRSSEKSEKAREKRRK